MILPDKELQKCSGRGFYMPLILVIVSAEHSYNRDPREMNYLTGILYNSDLVFRRTEKLKKTERDVCSVLPFLMTKTTLRVTRRLLHPTVPPNPYSLAA